MSKRPGQSRRVSASANGGLIFDGLGERRAPAPTIK
jgi:hypothetical protein